MRGKIICCFITSSVLTIFTLAFCKSDIDNLILSDSCNTSFIFQDSVIAAFDSITDAKNIENGQIPNRSSTIHQNNATLNTAFDNHKITDDFEESKKFGSNLNIIGQFLEKIKSCHFHSSEKSSRVLLKIFLLVCFLVTITFTFFFYKERVDKKRFLTTTRLSIMDKEVQMACRYIEHNFSDSDLTIDTICSELVTGKAFLNALFERDLGINVESFIDQVRINRVKIFLSGDEKIYNNELALNSGYKDVDSMLLKFKKITGVELEIYRESLIKLDTPA